jgi:hypothetical protein
MEIKFRDVGRGVVQARASLEITPGVHLNEVTIIKKGNDIEVELPQKSFKTNDGRVHFVDVITFENEQKKIVWLLEIKNAYLKWREKNRHVLVYENK